MDIEFTKLDELTFNLEEKMGSPAIMTAKQAEYLCRYFCLNNTPHAWHVASANQSGWRYRLDYDDMLPQPIRVTFTGFWLRL